MLKRDPRGSVAVQVYRRICDEVRSEVSEETKQMCHIFWWVALCRGAINSIAQLHTAIAAQRLRPTLNIALFV